MTVNVNMHVMLHHMATRDELRLRAQQQDVFDRLERLRRQHIVSPSNDSRRSPPHFANVKYPPTLIAVSSQANDGSLAAQSMSVASTSPCNPLEPL
jgi:hypothetical protein